MVGSVVIDPWSEAIAFCSVGSDVLVGDNESSFVTQTRTSFRAIEDRRRIL